jgi:N-acetylmuramoyl-L-alanine amidase
MKKLLLICIVGLLAAFPHFAEEKKEVSLRFSQHDSIMRVVLESDDNFIRSSNIIATPSSIKIEFPALFELKKEQDFIFDTSVKDRFLSVTLKNVEDVKSYKLISPARIVIDLKITQKISKEEAVQAEKKAEPKQGQKQGEEQQISKEEAVQAEKKAEPKQGQKQGEEQPAEKPAAPKVVFLDAGHGGYDYGIISKNAKEKDLNLLFARDLNAILSKKGYKVFLTRKADQSLSVLERIILANSKKPALFISIHSSASNAFVVNTATVDDPATETSVKLYSLSARQGRHIEKSRALAIAIGASLRDEFKGDIFTRELPLPVLNSMDSTAVLIEYPSLQLNTYDQKKRDLFVNAIVEGISSSE